MLKIALAACALLCALTINAEARRSGSWQTCTPTADVMRPCAYQPNFLAGVRSIKVKMKRDRRSSSRAQLAAAVVAHPQGCPSRAFCGCGAAVRVFGAPVRSLWLAANWYRFPRAAPAAGMVAVRRHHVFVLEQSLGGNTWLTYDANSGGHATRLHARSIAGYVIVNPRA